MKIGKLKNLCNLFVILLWTIKLKEEQNEKKTQALVTNSWFFFLFPLKLLRFHHIGAWKPLLTFPKYKGFSGAQVTKPRVLPFILKCARYPYLSLLESRFSLDTVQIRRSEKCLTLNLLKLV